jgi:hypothetical protein
MNSRLFTSKFLAVGLVTISTVLTSCAVGQGYKSQTVVNTAEQVAMSHELTVFHSPTCSCCSQWIEHMEAAGFQVEDKITEDMTAIKQQYGVPANLASCHTTIVAGYVVEGHVPAEDVQSLLTEKLDVSGITVPGMPIGSPGMESGNYVEPYTVFSFMEDGSTATFAKHS